MWVEVLVSPIVHAQSLTLCVRTFCGERVALLGDTEGNTASNTLKLS